MCLFIHTHISPINKLNDFSSSHVFLWLCIHDAFLDLSLLGFLNPSFNVIDPLIVCPSIELSLANVKYLPALLLQDLTG